MKLAGGNNNTHSELHAYIVKNLGLSWRLPYQKLLKVKERQTWKILVLEGTMLLYGAYVFFEAHCLIKKKITRFERGQEYKY